MQVQVEKGALCFLYLLLNFNRKIPMKNCPCGSTKLYLKCCGSFIEGKNLPETPEKLMRSRYTAYTMANIPYIEKTMRGPASKDFNRKEALTWAKSVTWLGLKVISTQTLSAQGFVEFIASFRTKNHIQTIEEISEFHFLDGKWYYVNGKMRK